MGVQVDVVGRRELSLAKNSHWKHETIWCKTRLLNSGDQFDQPCTLFDSTTLVRILYQRKVELSSPTSFQKAENVTATS